jgi:hypothetical protein
VSQDSSVDIATRLCAGQLRNPMLIPGRDKALGPAQSPTVVLGTHALGVKQQGYEADHSPPPSTTVKNGGATLLLLICLHGLVLN